MYQRVKIYPYQIGLVFEGDSFVTTLVEGTYWLRTNKEVRVRNRTTIGKVILSPTPPDVLLTDPVFRANIIELKVAEHEAVAVYCDGRFLELITSSCHCIYWKNELEYRFDHYDKSDLTSANELPAEVFDDHQARLSIISYQVEHYEQGFLIVDGIYSGRYEPGRYHFWRSRKRQVEMLKADLRAQLLEVSGQEILTSDKASLRLNYQLQYRIMDAEKALLQESDLTSRLYLGVQLALRTFVSGVTLDELLASKAAVNDYVQQALAALQDELGVTILEGGLRDIILPGDMKEIMNRVLVAEKQAQANTILRRDETAATRALLNSAKLMEDHPMLMRLKEMEYLERIAERVDSLSLSGGDQVLEQLRKLFAARSN